jgi:hypothetical protein
MQLFASGRSAAQPRKSADLAGRPEAAWFDSGPLRLLRGVDRTLQQTGPPVRPDRAVVRDSFLLSRLRPSACLRFGLVFSLRGIATGHLSEAVPDVGVHFDDGASLPSTKIPNVVRWPHLRPKLHVAHVP